MYKLVVVDDEDLIRRSLANESFWSEIGFEIVGIAGSGPDALQIIGKTSPDAMLVDIVMPDMDGIELIRNVKNLYPHIKCVILSTAP